MLLPNTGMEDMLPADVESLWKRYITAGGCVRRTHEQNFLFLYKLIKVNVFHSPLRFQVRSNSPH